MEVLTLTPSVKTVAELVRARRGEMTPAELKVAQSLLADYPAAGLQSAASLAAAAAVSAPTVVRFVAKLGFPGQAAFQRQLRAELSTRSAGPAQLYPASDLPASSSSLLRRCERRIGRSVIDTLRGADEVEFGRAVAMIADLSRPIVVTGGRASDGHARYAARYLQLLRPHVRHLDADRAERAAALLDITRTHTVVVFDYHRYERATIDFGAAAAARGAALVLFTDTYLSPLAPTATVLLTATVDGPGAFISLTPALALLEAVVLGVAERGGRTVRKRLADFDDLNTSTVL